ncbi:class I SAM-dependent methyltransferase [Tsukamurella soli]|uniref:Class I SAM-dependent methyltransferase n=1 Tax=Tsukamurella soli TaxID=644556 RepID=A0ABP8J864_9ACTN
MTGLANPFFSWVWPKLVRHEPDSLVALRVRNLAGLSGRVLEVGAGTGSNFPHYPPEVAEVVALEPEAALHELAAAAAAADSRIAVRHETLAEFQPETPFDAVVFSLVLCSLPDPAEALGQVRRCLSPDGELRFLEHVAAPGPMGAAQRVADATLWPRVFGNCHTHRDAAALVSSAGFEVRTRTESWLYPQWVPIPTSFVVLGRAGAA